MFSWGNNNWGQLGLVDVLNDQHVVPAGIKGTACRPVEHKEDTETSAKKGSLEVGRAFDIQVSERTRRKWLQPPTSTK
tara:strand:+ start:968 stop:1201 length:234 start_codon:yes stop_codon:yes gene_type:complete